MTSHLRSFLLCILIAAVAGTAAATVWWLTNFGPLSGGMNIDLLVTFFLIALVISCSACIVIGLPVAWLLMQRRLESCWLYGGIGFLAGGSITMFLLLGPPELGSTTLLISNWLLGAVPGAVSGICWWLLDRRAAMRAEP